ncbi:MAG: M24 family metallopeptidase [Chloroflexi bacterium]|nr:MAG: M24 family metallopeptidase [Chloroflexota bacterium]
MPNKQQVLQERLTAVQTHLSNWQVDALLIASATNRRWLSGFTGSNAQLLVTPDQATIATDSRYYQQATAQAPLFTLFKHERTEKETAVFLHQANAQKIGLEANHTTLEEAKKLEKAAPSVEWVHLNETVEPYRRIKAIAEVEAIQAAAAITDQAMSLVNEITHPGMSEKALAWELEKAMREAGADSMAFPIIVASGANASSPHHMTGDRQLQPGDAIIIDMGAQLNGYRSDMTRTFFLGNAPTSQFIEVYELVLAAQTAVLTQTRPGMKNKEIDSIARNLIGNAGHREHFGHGLGHGVGLDIHEDPFLSPRSHESETISAGMTLTVEPGVYIPGWGGVRIEDLTIITNEGLESLSHCPKNPIIPI